MGLLSFLKPNQGPVDAIEHPVLGPLRWSIDAKEWQGSYNGFTFGIAYEKDCQPAPELLAYAVELLTARTLLLDTLAAEKERWLSKYPRNAEEIRPLEFDSITLYRHKGVCRSIACLVPELERNSWRIEYQGTVCEGLGFDS
jgi:hypothetical protein